MSAVRNLDGRRGKPAARTDTPLLEWVLGVVGMLLLAAMVTFLVFQGLKDEGTPGAVRLVSESIVAVDDGYLVKVGVHNLGAQTLADLNLKVRLLERETEVESAQLTIDYLPGHATRKAGAFLRHDPSRYRLELVAEGYQEP